MTDRDTAGLPTFEYSIEAQRRTDVEQRTLRRAAVARLATTYRHPMALGDALESRTDALHMATLDEDGRIAARDGVYADAEMLANAWLTLDEGSYHGAFRAEPDAAPMHTCQTRAEWAAVWDDAAETGSWLTRQWYARQERAALVSESRADAVRELMGATSTYIADASDGLHITDITNVERNHRVKRNRAQYVERAADTEPDALYGRWREYDRTQSPLLYVRADAAPVTLREQSQVNPYAWHSVTGAGAPRAGVDGRQRERDAVRAAQRRARNAAQKVQNDKRHNDGHAIDANLTALLERVRVGTSEYRA